MTFEFKTRGTCSQHILFDVEDGKVYNVQFIGGCNGNLKGISALVEGMPIDDVIAKVDGIHCGMKATSCPDQLAQALKEAKAKLCG
ncbi:MAG: TIGR03905 family TSCPD domain-containing protein [Oscillospiraceae bacterium]|nr:TIGR03905 family TSCPD domain-containing protein [Oscillospiraceae bacterium]